MSNNFTGCCYNEYNYLWNVKTNIGNDVWIGAKCIILSGRIISDGAVIGTGSVVTHDVGPYEIWAGNPAKLIRKRFDEETIRKLLAIEWWNWDDKKLEYYGKYFHDPNELLSKLKM